MIKTLNITAIILLFFFVSCKSPQDYGRIRSVIDPICKRKFYIKNNSNDKKIGFIIKYTSITNHRLYEDTYEKPVGPQEEILLGCDGEADSINYEIVGAYLKND